MSQRNLKPENKITSLQKGVIVEVQTIETGEFKHGKITDLDKETNLLKIDFGNNQLEDDVHINRVKFPISKNVNQWTREKDRALKIMVAKLKFNREITRFYYYGISREEGYWAWTLILMSTFTSTLSLGNNVDIEPFLYYYKVLGFAITLMSTVTTLIAAWMKKQRYLDRINNCDRYLQKINAIIEQIDLILIHDPQDRMTYSEFNEKIYPNIQSLSTTPPMSPEEQKFCVYQITVNYPEIIVSDGDHDNKLWPWFDIALDRHSNPRITSYGESVIRSHIRDERKRRKYSLRYCFGCCVQHQDVLIDKYYNYMNLHPTFKTQEHLFKTGTIVLLHSDFFKVFKQHRTSLNCDNILGQIIKRHDQNNYHIKLVTPDQQTFDFLKQNRLLYFDVEDTQILSILEPEKMEKLYSVIETKKERYYKKKMLLPHNKPILGQQQSHLQNTKQSVKTHSITTQPNVNILPKSNVNSHNKTEKNKENTTKNSDSNGTETETQDITIEIKDIDEKDVSLNIV